MKDSCEKLGLTGWYILRSSAVCMVQSQQRHQQDVGHSDGPMECYLEDLNNNLKRENKYLKNLINFQKCLLNFIINGCS